MLKAEPDEHKRAVEREVINALRSKEYTLNTINSYGENLLHISAANGCTEIIQEIFKKEEARCMIDRKNKFGWTPLMLAIRNRDINTVKLLLQNGANINESTYLGMSVLGLAVAINKEMFEILHKACPSAILNVVNDDITPLCIAAMKNDKALFFRLMDLGLDVFKANEYTQIMMKQSMIPEIANLANKHLDIEDYWNNTSDNIPIEGYSNQKEKAELIIDYKSKHVLQPVQYNTKKFNYGDKNNNDSPIRSFCKRPVFKFDFIESMKDDVIRSVKDSVKSPKINLLPEHASSQQSLISPTLTCDINEVFPMSPNICFLQRDYGDKDNTMVQSELESISPIKNDALVQCFKLNKCASDSPSVPSQRLQSIRPSDLDIYNSPDDLNITLGYTPEFSPIRSPHVPSDINDENVFGENTPTPPRYKTPPRGIILNSEEAKMYVLLKHYGLSHHLPIFLEQEVDVDLLMTLTDQDLIEIGIRHKSDRNAVLAAIMDYRKIQI